MAPNPFQSPTFPEMVVILTALVFLTPGCGVAASDAPAEKPPRFTIVRDPKLGKPLLSLWMTPKDAAGRQAADVMEEFLVYVRDGDTDNAKKLCQFDTWTGINAGETEIVSVNELPSDPEYAKRAMAELAASEALFPRFVRELQQATRYTLGATVKQKSRFWNMRVVAEGVEQQPWPYAVDFSFEYGSGWRILVHDLATRYDPSRSIRP